jgi:aspartate carbamoyltransferase catalytic subunit
LGGNTLDLSESVFKNSRNESMRDIVKLLGYYCDAIVARTKSESSIEEFARNSEVPIISAGHGKCEHPTVGMGHLFSIWKSIGHLSGLSILVIAKLPKRGVNSMVRLLGRYEDVRLIFLTSPCGRLPSDVERPFKHGIGNELRYVSGLDEIDDLKKIDAIVIDDSERDYVDKVGSPDYWNPSFDKFVLDTFRDDVILTAGLPRTRLLPADMDEDPRCRHLTKSRDSFHIRAAILLFVLGQLK